jgi:hypothetical protein
MTSEAKAALTMDTSGLADGLPQIASSVVNPLNDLKDAIEDKAIQYVSVSATDTHVKHLDDAISVSGEISKSIVNAEGNEQVRFAVSGGTAQWNANKIQDRAVSNASPNVGNTLVWDGTQWLPGTPGSGGGSSIAPNGVAEGRLTLTTATPVTTSDVTAANYLYYTPYTGNRISLYNGVTWDILSFAELELLIAAYTANKNYDIFAYISDGAATLTAQQWTDDSTRETALARQNGILVLSGTPTYRYLGTIRITGTLGQCEDSLKRRYVWNYYNRINRRIYAVDNNGSSYIGTLREYRNTSDNRAHFVIGVSEEVVSVRAQLQIEEFDSTAESLVTNIGVDGVISAITRFNTNLDNSLMMSNPVAYWDGYLSAGYHYISAYEGTNPAMGTFLLATLQSDIIGSLMG